MQIDLHDFDVYSAETDDKKTLRLRISCRWWKRGTVSVYMDTAQAEKLAVSLLEVSGSEKRVAYWDGTGRGHRTGWLPVPRKGTQHG